MPTVRGRGVLALRHRRALTRTAVGAVAAGLPVMPGAWWSAAERCFACDRPGCARTGPHPVLSGETGVGGLLHPETVARLWRQAPYAVLVPTGRTCDVVDVPDAVGRLVARRLDARSALGPVIAAGSRWFFLTTPGGRVPALGGDVIVHGIGSWIMLPPSQGPGGEPAVWLARPSRRGGWFLPPRDEVMRAVDQADGRPERLSRTVWSATVVAAAVNDAGPVAGRVA